MKVMTKNGWILKQNSFILNVTLYSFRKLYSQWPPKPQATPTWRCSSGGGRGAAQPGCSLRAAARPSTAAGTQSSEAAGPRGGRGLHGDTLRKAECELAGFWAPSSLKRHRQNVCGLRRASRNLRSALWGLRSISCSRRSALGPEEHFLWPEGRIAGLRSLPRPEERAVVWGASPAAWGAHCGAWGASPAAWGARWGLRSVSCGLTGALWSELGWRRTKEHIQQLRDRLAQRRLRGKSFWWRPSEE